MFVLPWLDHFECQETIYNVEIMLFKVVILGGDLSISKTILIFVIRQSQFLA